MPKITWPDKLTTGITLIDEQHRRIIDLLNALQETIERGELTLANQTLATLLEHKVAHAAYEETLLKSSGFPFFKPHKHAHDEVIQECSAYLQRAQQGEYVSHNALAFLKPWMVKHIRGEDTDYVEYVKRHQAGGGSPTLPWHLRTLNRLFPGSGKR